MSRRAILVTVVIVLLLAFWVIVDQRDAEGSTRAGVDKVQGQPRAGQ